MGLLDDAIRQHLELKRAHGADESELKRKEDEALGPVRREAEPAAEGGGGDAAAPEQPPAEERAAAPSEPVPASRSPRSRWRSPTTTPSETTSRSPTSRRPWPSEPAPAEEPPPAVSNTPTRGFDALSEEELEDEPFAEEPAPAPPSTEPPAGDAEDVLEETPEFLQETPEHDRLWFEQKPPRDFDFDDEREVTAPREKQRREPPAPAIPVSCFAASRAAMSTEPSVPSYLGSRRAGAGAFTRRARASNKRPLPLQWSQPGSNRRPSRCKRDALPAELWPRDAMVRTQRGPSALNPWSSSAVACLSGFEEFSSTTPRVRPLRRATPTKQRPASSV